MSFAFQDHDESSDPSRGRGQKGWLFALLVAVLSACGGAAGENGSPGGEPASTAGAAGAVTDQEAADGPRFGPGGQLIRVVTVSVGGVPISVEIADTPALRERGLMQRDSLPDDAGMLFVYADEQVRSFWMRNTKIPLDIAFIDRNGSIVSIEQMQPQTDANTVSSSPAMYALEMNQGWFEANGVGVGDRLEF